MNTDMRTVELHDRSYVLNCDHCNELLDRDIHSFGGNKLLTIYRLDGSNEDHIMMHKDFKKHTTKRGFFKDHAIERCTFTKAAIKSIRSYTQ